MGRIVKFAASPSDEPGHPEKALSSDLERLATVERHSVALKPKVIPKGHKYLSLFSRAIRVYNKVYCSHGLYAKKGNGLCCGGPGEKKERINKSNEEGRVLVSEVECL